MKVEIIQLTKSHSVKVSGKVDPESNGAGSLVSMDFASSMTASVSWDKETPEERIAKLHEVNDSLQDAVRDAVKRDMENCDDPAWRQIRKGVGEALRRVEVRETNRAKARAE
jgi:hypothetical protein